MFFLGMIGDEAEWAENCKNFSRIDLDQLQIVPN